MVHWAKRVATVLVCIALSTICASGAFAQEAPVAVDPAVARLEAFVDGLVEGAMRREHIAGIGVVVVRGDEVMLLKGYGKAKSEGARVDPEQTLFRVASISKTFTAIALMRLVEEGRINLDNPVNAYLPPALRLPDDGFQEPVRVRHLLTHSAGFEDLFAGRLFVARPETALPLVDSVVHNRPKRVRQPGAGAVYSNYGWALAGAVIQHVTGQPFEAYVEQAVFSPLGLQNTTFREPYPASLANSRGLPSPMSPSLEKDVAQGFRWQNGRFEPQPFEYVVQYAPAGSASATPADMGRYLLGLKAGLPGVLRPETARLFSAETPFYTNATGVSGIVHGMFQVRSPEGRRGYGHQGDTLWFHSDFAIYPELDLGVFITTNSERGWTLRDTFAGSVADWYADAVGAPVGRAAATAPVALPFRKFAGTYFSDRRSYSNAEKALCLARCVETVSAAGDGLVLSDGADTARLLPAGSDSLPRGFAIHRFRDAHTGEIHAFESRNGQVLRYLAPWGGGRSERVSVFAGPGGFILVSAIGGLAALAALLSGLSRVFSAVQPAPAARLVGLLLPSAGAAWLVALGALVSFAGEALANPWTIFAAWPGVLAVSVWGAAVGAALTVLAVIATVVAWLGSDWSAWRRARIAATLAGLIALGVLFYAWRLVGPIA